MLSVGLLADGSSDEILLGPMHWAIVQQSGLDASFEFVDLAFLRSPPSGLGARCRAACDLHNLDVLAVHRDAEREALAVRRDEVMVAASAALHGSEIHVPIVPVRMTEAWFLFCESAIRAAANNRRGSVDLELPRVSELETVSDPKDLLLDRLHRAANLSARRTRRFNVHKARRRIPQFIDDYSALKVLPAFATFLEDVEQVLVKVH